MVSWSLCNLIYCAKGWGFLLLVTVFLVYKIGQGFVWTSGWFFLSSIFFPLQGPYSFISFRLMDLWRVWKAKGKDEGKWNEARIISLFSLMLSFQLVNLSVIPWSKDNLNFPEGCVWSKTFLLTDCLAGKDSSSNHYRCINVGALQKNDEILNLTEKRWVVKSWVTNTLSSLTMGMIFWYPSREAGTVTSYTWEMKVAFRYWQWRKCIFTRLICFPSF